MTKIRVCLHPTFGDRLLKAAGSATKPNNSRPKSTPLTVQSKVKASQTKESNFQQTTSSDKGPNKLDKVEAGGCKQHAGKAAEDSRAAGIYAAEGSRTVGDFEFRWALLFTKQNEASLSLKFVESGSSK